MTPDADRDEGVEDIALLRNRIIGQADAQGDEGWMEIDVPEAVNPGGKIQVPRAPFEGWALKQAGFAHLALPWTPVSPQGTKQEGDDPLHSDWLLGGGFSIHDMMPFVGFEHAKLLRNAAYDAAGAVQSRFLGYGCTVLMPGPAKTCIAFVPSGPDDVPAPSGFPRLPPAAILPDAGPSWLAVGHAALKLGGAVIVEQGGAMAHLITVLREDCQGPIIRVADALVQFEAGTRLHVDSARGQVVTVDATPKPLPELVIPPGFRR